MNLRKLPWLAGRGEYQNQSHPFRCLVLNFHFLSLDVARLQHLGDLCQRRDLPAFARAYPSVLYGGPVRILY